MPDALTTDQLQILLAWALQTRGYAKTATMRRRMNALVTDARFELGPSGGPDNVEQRRCAVAWRKLEKLAEVHRCTGIGCRSCPPTHTTAQCDEHCRLTLPHCVREMGCFCPGHARGDTPVNHHCNPTEAS